MIKCCALILGLLWWSPFYRTDSQPWRHRTDNQPGLKQVFFIFTPKSAVFPEIRQYRISVSNAAVHQKGVWTSIFKTVLNSEVAPEYESAVTEHPSLFVMLTPRLLPAWILSLAACLPDLLGWPPGESRPPRDRSVTHLIKLPPPTQLSTPFSAYSVLPPLPLSLILPLIPFSLSSLLKCCSFSFSWMVLPHHPRKRW